MNVTQGGSDAGPQRWNRFLTRPERSPQTSGTAMLCSGYGGPMGEPMGGGNPTPFFSGLGALNSVVSGVSVD